MPTTRRGRFLFYKARARKRYRRWKAKKRSGPVTGVHYTQREREAPPWGKQAVKKYPRIADWTSTKNPFVPMIYTKAGGHGRPPVFHPIHPDSWYGFTNHGRFATLLAQHRRVLHFPPLRYLPLVPYATSAAGVVPHVRPVPLDE